MANIRTAESAYLGGKAWFENWKKKFLADFYAPYDKTVVRSLFLELPEEVLENVKKIDPEAYEFVIDLIGGKDATET